MKRLPCIATTLLSSGLLLPATATADANFYASVRVSALATDNDDGSDAELTDNSSRIGVHGRHEIGDGTALVGRLEVGVNTVEGSFGGGEANRLAYLGLESDLGGIYLGTQWSPYYLAVGGSTDRFNALGARHTHAVERLTHSLKYAASLSVISLETALVMRDNSEAADTRFAVDPDSGEITATSIAAVEDEDTIDRIQFAGTFRAKRATIALAVDHKADSGVSGSAGNVVGIATTYEDDTLIGAVSFHNTDKERLDAQWAGDQALKQVELYAGYKFAGTNLLHIAYGQSDDGSRTPSTLTLGFQHQISETARIWVEGETTHPDQPDTGNEHLLAVGIRYNWE
ncbi:porin [Granulosicoccaceae sp. 1_MG-2023]|nr:porin [Granulosicoccaceae sp. 1_MG-2023]